MNRHVIDKYILNSAFIAVSLILGWFGRIPVIPMLPFLYLDLSDVPIYFSAIFLDPGFGAIALITSSFLRMMFFSSSGFLGFFIRISSIISVLTFGVFYHKFENKIYKIIVCILTVIFGVTIKTLVSYILCKYFLCMPKDSLHTYFFVAALPYNFIKYLLSVVGSLVLSKICCRKSHETFV